MAFSNGTSSRGQLYMVQFRNGLSTLRACPRSVAEAPALVRTPAGPGGHGHQAPGRTRESERKSSGPKMSSRDARSGVHDKAAAVLYYF